MASEPLLFRRGNDRSFATGGVRYVDADRRYPGLDARIVIPLAIPLLRNPVLAVVDTAAPWCIFEREVGALLMSGLSPVLDRVILSTRLGTLRGALYRAPVTLAADEGRSLDLEATVFLSPDWRGPNFVGYEGFLQRIRFAVDPGRNHFYFGPLE